MLQIDAAGLIARLIELQGSTTFFLESLKGDRLKVNVELQGEIMISSCCFIRRVVKLYFYSSASPVLYCVSHLNKDQLTSEEYASLVEEQLPIGTIFHRFNDSKSILKRNLSVSREINPQVAVLLNVQHPEVIKKQYNYCVGGRDLGCIYEFFNEESIVRL